MKAVEINANLNWVGLGFALETVATESLVTNLSKCGLVIILDSTGL
jgi:hypothetical protein